MNLYFSAPPCLRGEKSVSVNQKHQVGILLSGRGSNFLAIADSIDAGRIPHAEIAIVISNKEDAPAVAAAKKRGLDARVIPSKGKTREQHDAEMIQALREKNVDLVCLAGYMRLLSPEFIRAFQHKILNIHPSLLPAFPGLDAQKQALEYGVKVSGCTVHFVDEALDHGPIILQKTVPLLPEDDEHSLSERILKEEHKAYSEAIALVLDGNVSVQGRHVVPSKGKLATDLH
jgi:phosphoribosylglycinamide formyltransferase-1